jgi:hypothetical protein
MTFDGTFYFTSPVHGRVTGAVFRGKGRLTAPVPNSPFEQDNLRRMLNSDKVESDFQSAFLMFTDDTFKTIGAGVSPGEAPAEVTKTAVTAVARGLQETGTNLIARTAISILNEESPGFFFAQFEGGALNGLTYVFDPQCRIPVSSFDINGGEKGLLYRFNRDIFSPEILMAFYSLDDYERRQVSYSDQNDIVDIESYDMTADVRAPEKLLRLKTKIFGKVLAPKASGISFTIGENLSLFNSARLKKQLRVRSARMGGAALAVFQEDWEKGFSIFLPSTLTTGQKFEIDVDLEGDFMLDSEAFSGCHYPSSNGAWYPRHGYLDRATYNMTFLHRKKNRIASSGVRTSRRRTRIQRMMSLRPIVWISRSRW